MANPQPEPFVQFSKELFDAILRSPMPGTHKEIVLAVVRRTYGDFGKKSAPVSLTLLGSMLGRNIRHVRRCLADLQEQGVIVTMKPATFNEPRVLALAKDYESWGRYSVSPVGESPTEGDMSTVGVEDPSSVGVDAPSTGGKMSTPQWASTPSPQWACTPPIEDKRDKETREDTSSNPPHPPAKKAPKVKAPDDTDWEQRSKELLEAAWFPSDMMQLAELLAGTNKTKTVALSRVVRELYAPIVALQGELSRDALRYGLRAAITRSAPNANYVKSAAHNFRTPTLSTGARATSGVAGDEWESDLQEAYADA